MPAQPPGEAEGSVICDINAAFFSRVYEFGAVEGNNAEVPQNQLFLFSCNRSFCRIRLDFRRILRLLLI